MARVFTQIGFAFKCFFLVLFAGRLPDELPDEFRPANKPRSTPPTPPATAGTDRATVAERGRSAAQDVRPPASELDRAVQLLALLQRDGRLVDFLFEDISGYPDDQVGAAAREVHGSSRQVLERYLALEPVLRGDEGRPTVVEAGFDPGAIKLVGDIAGRPPFTGVLRHRGWKVAKLSLPALPDGASRSIVAPAEVEIG